MCQDMPGKSNAKRTANEGKILGSDSSDGCSPLLKKPKAGLEYIGLAAAIEALTQKLDKAMGEQKNFRQSVEQRLQNLHSLTG